MAATIDKELVTALKAAKGGNAMQFAFVAKGSTGKLLAGKKVSPKDAAELKKEVGGSLVRGRLVGQDGVLVFETAKEPPPTLLGQLKKVIKESAALTLPLQVRANAAAEVEESEGEAASPPPPLSPPSPVAGKEQSAPPPVPPGGMPPPPRPDASVNASPLSPPPPVTGKDRTTQPPGPPGAVPPPPRPDASGVAPPSLSPPPPIAKKSGDASANDVAKEGSRLMGELNALTPEIKAALAAHPARKNELLKLVQGFQSQIKAKDHDEAQDSLDRIKSVLVSFDNADAEAEEDEVATEEADESEDEGAAAETEETEEEDRQSPPSQNLDKQNDALKAIQELLAQTEKTASDLEQAGTTLGSSLEAENDD